MTNRLFLNSVLKISALGLALGSVALADDSHLVTSLNRPVIEIGAGAQNLGAGLNILMKVGFSVHKYTNSPSENPAVREYQEQLVIAHFSGDFGISTQSGGDRLPFVDLEFIPVDNHLEFVNNPGQLVVMGNVRFLPVQLNRNLQIDEQLGVRVSAIGIQLDAISYSTQESGVIAQLAVDALGYKMVSYVAGLGKFAGFHLAQASLEAGYANYVSEAFNIRVVIGGSADINFGHDSIAGSSTQSDQQAYLSIKATLHEMVQIFLKGGVMHTSNSGIEIPTKTAPFVQGGGTFIF